MWLRIRLKECRAGPGLNACSPPASSLRPLDPDDDLFSQAARHKFPSSQVTAVQPDELIRQTTINRVKSQQAIRRSTSLVKGTKNMIERCMHAPERSADHAKDTTLPAETVRQEARKLREHSRQAVEQSKAARQRQRALRNK